MITYIESNFIDYPDSSCMCVSVFFQGCDIGCKDCHNPSLATPAEFINDIEEYSDRLYSEILSRCKRSRTKNISFVGGDPLFKNNIELTKLLSTKLLDTGYNLIIYTGYDISVARDNSIPFTFLKSGVFDRNKIQKSKLTDDSLILASTNQKIYDKEFNLLSIDGVFKYK